MRRIFSFVAFALWIVAAFANLLSLDISLALRSTFPTLIASSVLSGLFLILFSWRAFVSFANFTNSEKQPKIFLGLFTMIISGLFLISYAIKDRELPGKYGECSVLLRPAYFNPNIQNKINEKLKGSPGYIRAAVLSLEALCAKSKKHQSKIFLDSAFRGEDPNQHQFQYKEDAIGHFSIYERNK